MEEEFPGQREMIAQNLRREWESQGWLPEDEHPPIWGCLICDNRENHSPKHPDIVLTRFYYQPETRYILDFAPGNEPDITPYSGMVKVSRHSSVKTTPHWPDGFPLTRPHPDGRLRRPSVWEAKRSRRIECRQCHQIIDAYEDKYLLAVALALEAGQRTITLAQLRAILQQLARHRRSRRPS
jgi:hypothetical protein